MTILHRPESGIVKRSGRVTIRQVTEHPFMFVDALGSGDVVPAADLAPDRQTADLYRVRAGRGSDSADR
ncbi:hypothetical protein [Tropicibacter sp. S64]|uniref:hypothetical protein n=1 Tax=Tropicibacter sp. S64 TaxID=3415122 RepID=UPI003C7AD434